MKTHKLPAGQKAPPDEERAGRAGRSRLSPSLLLTAVVLLAAWMGYEYGGYFVDVWAVAAGLLAALAFVMSAAGLLGRLGSRWTSLALGLFAGYTAWTFASLLWAPNKGDAWAGAGYTLLYLLSFGVAVYLISLGASRLWVLAASALGPAVVAGLTLLGLSSRVEELFEDLRLIGTIGYYNGEAAFLLVPFWAAIYVGGSRRANPLLRGLVLGGAVLCVSAAVLTQSRGAMVAMAVSIPVFFLFSGQRLRGLLALAPVAAVLFVVFPDLNRVYLELLNRGDPSAVLRQTLPLVWLSSAGVGLYALLWGLADWLWEPPRVLVRGVGVVVLVGVIAVSAAGATTFYEREGDPVAWGAQKWEAFESNDISGQDQSRYLSASGSGRYTLWQVAWKDFTANPLLGVGTHNYEATYYQLREVEWGWVRQPHMLPLEVLGERGAIGGVLFAAFISVCLLSGLRYRFGNLDPEGKAQVGAMAAAVTYWFVHSSAEWFWQMPAITLPAAVYLAMLAAPWRRIEPVPLRWPARTGIAALAVMSLAVVTPLYVANHYLEHSYASNEPDDALAAAEKAKTFNPVAPVISQREAEVAARAGYNDRAETAYREMIRLNPEHFAPYALYAEYHEVRGNYPEALSLYEKALDRNPLDKDMARTVEQIEEAE